jgi:hypothetical protein
MIGNEWLYGTLAEYKPGRSRRYTGMIKPDDESGPIFFKDKFDKELNVGCSVHCMVIEKLSKRIAVKVYRHVPEVKYSLTDPTTFTGSYDFETFRP